MTGSVLLVARSRCRNRWGGLGGIAVVVAVFSVAVLVALVGAHRTATSVDRFRDWAHSSDVAFQGQSVEQAQTIKEALDADPAVRQTSLRYLANAFPISEEDSLPDIAILSDPAGEFGVDLDRMRMIEGRTPDPSSPDEVIVNEVAAELLGVGPGDVLPVLTFGGDDLDVLSEGTSFPGFNGPQVDLEVVGVGRAPRDLPGELRRTDLVAVAGPDFLDDNPVAAWPPTVVTRLDDVERDLDEVTRRVDRAFGDRTPDSEEAYRASVTTAADEYVDTTQSSVDGLAVGLLIFTLVVAAAGTLATAQIAGREARSWDRSDETLRALGMERTARTLAVALPTFGAASVGVLVGACAAVALSPVLPTGRARLAEVDPGVWVGLPVLLAGVAGLILLVAAVALRSGSLATRRRSPEVGSGRVTFTSRVIAAFGLGAVFATGLRRASPDRRAGSAPARSAMIGMAVAIAGVLAAGVVVTSIESLQSDPAHWGWTWSTTPDAFGGDDPMPVLIEDPDVAGVGILSTGSVVLEDQEVQGMSLAAAKGDLAFTLLDGRLPSSSAEVALGRQTLEDLGLSIGDTVAAGSPDGSASTSLQVVGTAVFPPTELATLDEGAAFTPDGLDRVLQGAPSPEVVIRYGEGIDVPALEQRLMETVGLEFPVFSRARVPGSITNIAQASGVAWALAVFFLVIGVVGLLNALTVSVRRNGRDLAILRALGFRGRQVREATLVQALTLSAVGLLVGVPMGLIAGRAVWRALSSGLGVVADPQVPWVLIWTVVPATAAVAALLSWWPGRFAARSRPAVQLRAE